MCVCVRVCVGEWGFFFFLENHSQFGLAKSTESQRHKWPWHDKIYECTQSITRISLHFNRCRIAGMSTKVAITTLKINANVFFYIPNNKQNNTKSIPNSNNATAMNDCIKHTKKIHLHAIEHVQWLSIKIQLLFHSIPLYGMHTKFA